MVQTTAHGRPALPRVASPIIPHRSGNLLHVTNLQCHRSHSEWNSGSLPQPVRPGWFDYCFVNLSLFPPACGLLQTPQPSVHTWNIHAVSGSGTALPAPWWPWCIHVVPLGPGLVTAALSFRRMACDHPGTQLGTPGRIYHGPLHICLPIFQGGPVAKLAIASWVLMKMSLPPRHLRVQLQAINCWAARGICNSDSTCVSAAVIPQLLFTVVLQPLASQPVSWFLCFLCLSLGQDSGRTGTLVRLSFAVSE